jgi:hypothetical protein
MVPTGPVERVQIVPELPAGMAQHDVYQGDSPVGPKNAIQDWGYAFDSNSEPKLDGILIETSDGADLRLTIKMRATGPGVVALPKLQISGWDSTPKAASVSCEIPIGWTWGVIPFDPPIVKGESVKTDASYFAANADEANDGEHGLVIDVLANDDDANTQGGVGNTDEVRIESWQLTSDAGADVDCGDGEFVSPNPEDEPFEDLFTADCTYSPVDGFEGTDTFRYTVRQRSDGTTADGVVKVTVVPNRRPLTALAELYATSGQDEDYDVSAYHQDPEEEPTECLTTLVSPPVPANGIVTMNADCTFHWESLNNNDGAVEFTYRVCDTHQLLGSHGPNAVAQADYNNGIEGDLSATTSRRCQDADVTLIVSDGLLLPPLAPPDWDVVDAGYAGDGVGPYSVLIDVLADDFDHNGPDPTDAAIQNPPMPSEGVAEMVGEQIRFTPADGFSGPVEFTYLSCEDPALQDPPYPGLPLCGVGKVQITVLPNAAPDALDDFAVAVAPTGVIVDRDLAANDVEPDDEALVCDTTLVGVDPAFITSATLGADCLLDVDPVDGVTGSTSFSYRICDSHALAFPLSPAAPYGADGREPGDVAPRCDTAEVNVFVIQPLVIDPEGVPQIDPGPEGPPDDVDPTLPPDTTVPPDTTAPGVPVTPPTTAQQEIPNPGELPRTGGGSGGILLIGAVLLGLGAMTVGVARRRRTA